VSLVLFAAVVLAAAGAGSRSPLEAVLGFLGLVTLAVGVAWLLPRALARLRDQRDLFLIVSVATSLALAGAASVYLRIPMALAAFVAGLAITESEEATEARRVLLPFRDLLAVLFFVAIGTLIDPAVLGTGLPWLALLVGLVVAAKSIPAYVLARLACLPARPLQLAVGLSQIGEFSFVLASAGRAFGVMPYDVYVAILAAVALTIAGSTVAVRLVGRGRSQPGPAVAPSSTVAL
jgi:CPA2 family monovalent cation:H+ antiporter-2